MARIHPHSDLEPAHQQSTDGPPPPKDQRFRGMFEANKHPLFHLVCQRFVEGEVELGVTFGLAGPGMTQEKIKIGISIPTADHGWTGGINWWAKKAVSEFGPKYPDVEFMLVAADAPAKQLLVAARKNGRPGLRLDPPLCLYHGTGKNTRLSEKSIQFCPFLACNAGARNNGGDA